MEPLASPTDMVRDYATASADNISHFVSNAEQEVKQLLEQRVFENGVRGSAMALRGKLEDVQGLVTRLRKSIHDDYGTPREAA